MPNPYSVAEGSDSSDDSKRMGSKAKGRSFNETLAVVKASLLNLVDMTQELQAKHNGQVENFKNQISQQRKELKLAGAFTKTLSRDSTSSIVLRPSVEATADDRIRVLARLSGGSAEIAQLPQSPTSGSPERLAEAKRRRSDRGSLVLQGGTLYGATKKRASRQSTMESIASVVDSTATPPLSGDGSYSNGGMSSGTPPMFTQVQSQPQTFAEYKPLEPPIEEPPDNMRFRPPLGERRVSTEDAGKDFSPAETASNADTEVEQFDTSGEESLKMIGTLTANRTTEGDGTIFKLHEAWRSTPELASRRSLVAQVDTRTSRRGSSMLKRSFATEDLGIVSQTSPTARALKMCTLHPESSLRISWDLTGMIFLAYDFVTVPLQVFGEVFEDSQTSFSLSVAGTSFWTLDVLVSLRTGVLQKEVVVMSPWLIFLNYLKTWMLLDLFLIGLDWGVISSGSEKSAAGSARMLKFLRVFRLLRLRKVMDFLSKVEAMSNSNLAILLLSVFKHVVILVMLNHLIACLWYAVGEESSGWTFVARGMEVEDLSYRYLTSLHWSITQFHGTMEISPTNGNERLLSVLVLIFSMIGNAAFISAVTNKMMQAQNLVQEKTRIEQSFRSYLREHNVSLGLSIRLKKAISNVQMDKQSKEAKIALLGLIPPNLLLQLHMETRGPTILGHIFFRRMNSLHAKPVSQIIDQGVQDFQYPAKSDVFSLGEVAKCMYFIESGDMTYKFFPDRPTRTAGSRHSYGSEKEMDAQFQNLSKGERVSEAPLWVKWHHVGRFTSLTDVSLLELNSEVFMKIVQTSKPMHTDASIYARTFVTTLELMSHDSELITDLVTTPEEMLKRSGSDASSLGSSTGD